MMVEQQLEQYLCVDLIGRFIVGTVFSFQIFFPNLNNLFVILIHFPERKKAQQACQFSRCYRESPSLNRFYRVCWIIKFFSQYCLPHASKQSFIWTLFHLLSKALYFWNHYLVEHVQTVASDILGYAYVGYLLQGPYWDNKQFSLTFWQSFISN